MTRLLGTRNGILAGRSVFLSASVPSPDRAEKYLRLQAAQVEIEDAVVSLTRAVLYEGGRLVFGGHPSISPLVAMVAGEYRSPIRLEEEPDRVPSVEIHQLDAYRTELPDATTFMAEMGQALVTWHPMAIEGRETRASGGPRFPSSLRAMRVAMLRDDRLAAMVCIGGMEGVEEEAELFASLRPGAPVFVMARTGGASAILAREPGLNRRFRVIDDELLNELNPRLRRSDEELAAAPLENTPYAFIMQRLVREIGRGSANG